MKILLIGSTGQLGRELIKSSPKNIDLIYPSKINFDLSNTTQCYKYILDTLPDWVINSGAYTNVDKAEKEKEIAYEINAKGPQSIAKALSKTNGKLIHISTDYVFNGEQNTPYKVNKKISPINYYGFSKAKGEELIQKLLPENNKLCIIRTSWLMSPYGNNFATKIMKSLQDRDEVKVVYDQISSPTSTKALANAIWKAIELNNLFSLTKKNFPKMIHFSNSGVASWYDVAEAIGEIGIKKGLIKEMATLLPIESSEYQTAALRPKYSVLESSQTKRFLNIRNLHWRKALLEDFENFLNHQNQNKLKIK